MFKKALDNVKPVRSEFARVGGFTIILPVEVNRTAALAETRLVGSRVPGHGKTMRKISRTSDYAANLRGGAVRTRGTHRCAANKALPHYRCKKALSCQLSASAADRGQLLREEALS